MPLKFTGERFIPDAPESYASIAYEHWHRYAYAKRFAAGRRVLDAACGEGYGSALLAEVAESVVGVDIDPEALQHARSTHGRDNLRYLEGSVAKLPLTDERFDLVTSFETIEHVDEAAQLAFIRDVRRVLKDDGVFIISSPDRKTYSDERGYRNPYHVRELYFEEFRDMLKPHFKHVEFLAQGIHGVSYLHPLDGSEGHLIPMGVKELSGGRFQTDDSVPSHLYYIAICSNEPVTLPQSLLWERSEALLDETAVPLRAEIMRFGRENERLGKLLEEARNTIAARDRELANVNAMASAANATLSAMRSTIAAMQSTRAWRAKTAIEDVTAKLAELRSKLRQPRS